MATHSPPLRHATKEAFEIAAEVFDNDVTEVFDIPKEVFDAKKVFDNATEVFETATAVFDNVKEQEATSLQDEPVFP